MCPPVYVIQRVRGRKKIMTKFQMETAEGGKKDTSYERNGEAVRSYEALSESAVEDSGDCLSVEASRESRSEIATSGGPVGGPHATKNLEEEKMSGLFVLVFWREQYKLHEQTIYASNLKGALNRATRIISKCPMKGDMTIAVIYAKEHNVIRRRRFYSNGEAISPWIDFSEAIDEY